MESKIKVDYASRFGKHVGDEKEPVIRIELLESEDPRDTLLTEIFKDGIFTNLEAIQMNHHIKYDDSDPKKLEPLTYFIVPKTDNQKVYELAHVTWRTLMAYSGIECELSSWSGEYRFENYGLKVISNPIPIENPIMVESGTVLQGCSSENYNSDIARSRRKWDKEQDFISRMTEEWKNFEKQVKTAEILRPAEK